MNKIHNDKLILPTVLDEVVHVYHILSIRCDQRGVLQEYLRINGVGTNIHYPMPIRLQRAYTILGKNEGDYSVAEKISKTQLSLPMYYGLADEEIDYIIEVLNKF